MSVSATARRKALAHDRDLGGILRPGLAAARRIGFKAQNATVWAFRRRQDAVRTLQRLLEPMVPLVRDAMLAAHYRGILRAGVSRPELRQPLSLASAAYEGALKTLKKRFDLSPEAEARIQEAYAAEAVTVVKTAETAVEKRVQQALIVAQARGMHVRDGVKELRKAFKASGLTPQNSFTLEAIFRTQTQMAYSAGRWHANNHPAVQEILWGYEYVTVGDDRVRPEHVGLDGVTLPKEDPQWNVIFPPNGWACRCQAIEIFDEGEEIVRPPAMVEVDGKDVVPGADKGFAFNPGRLFGDPEPPVLRSVK